MPSGIEFSGPIVMAGLASLVNENKCGYPQFFSMGLNFMRRRVILRINADIRIYFSTGRA